MTSPLRWQIKKLTRKSMALGSWATGYVAIANARRESVVRVLTYHRFGRVERDPFCIDPGDFEKQMGYLAEHRLAVSLSEFGEFVSGKIQLRSGAVLVTIDDGFRSFYTTALPILRHYAIPAVAFVTAGLVRAGDAQPLVASEPEDYLTWDELEVLRESGVAIGSHGWTHQSLGCMSTPEIEEQAVLSFKMLEQRLGCPAMAFAYPFGTCADFNSMTAAILRQTGYRCAFTSQHGPIRSGMDPFCLPRVKVEGGEALWLFRLLVRGGMDNWRWIDRALWRWQASER
ncbi:MAG: polysaccharide deacetylase family protein [Dissulfurispiraceae bacterium]